MPVPSLSKTWVYTAGAVSTLNRTRLANGVLLDDSRAILRDIKNMMVNNDAATKWTVRYSCDGTTAGTAGDGVDRWDADSKLVWGTGAHSWIVLRNTGIAATFEIVIDLNVASSGATINVIASTAAFTGGTTNARPTATAECALGPTPITWLAGAAGSFSYNLAMSNDGECTRFFAFAHAVSVSSPAPVALWIIDKPQGPVSGWTDPYIGMVRGGSIGTAMPTYQNLVNATPSTNILRGRHGSTNFDANFTTEIYGTSTIHLGERLLLPNDMSGEWAFVPCGFSSETTGARGRHGNLFDMWMGPTHVRSGDTFPLSLTRQFVKFGDLILPWNSAAGRVKWG